MFNQFLQEGQEVLVDPVVIEAARVGLVGAIESVGLVESI
jgi:hypothetical protein